MTRYQDQIKYWTLDLRWAEGQEKYFKGGKYHIQTGHLQLNMQLPNIVPQPTILNPLDPRQQSAVSLPIPDDASHSNFPVFDVLIPSRY